MSTQVVGEPLQDSLVPLDVSKEHVAVPAQESPDFEGTVAVIDVEGFRLMRVSATHPAYSPLAPVHAVIIPQRDPVCIPKICISLAQSFSLFTNSPDPLGLGDFPVLSHTPTTVSHEVI